MNHKQNELQFTSLQPALDGVVQSVSWYSMVDQMML